MLGGKENELTDGDGDRLKKVLGWWRVRDPGWQWTLDCRDPKPDNQIND